MADTVPLPLTLRELIDHWTKEGRPAQAPTMWPRDRWSGRFERHREHLEALPDALDRAAVRSACSTAAASPRAAEEAFLTAMVWGYGIVGYGPWRVDRVLSQNRAAARKLHTIATMLHGEGAVAAYARFSDYRDCRLRYLGPAFGTKYLAFTSPANRAPALILDRLVAQWLGANAGLSIDPVVWHRPTYERYLDRMYRWAEALGVQPEELECLVFTAQSDLLENQWGAHSRRPTLAAKAS